MKTTEWRSRAALAALIVCVAVWLAGCNEYYVPPPPVSISLSALLNELVITTFDSNGLEVPSTLTVSGAVLNAADTNIIYYVGQAGTYYRGGDAQFGFINAAGVYTAPTVLPNPSVITIEAVAEADTTQTATATISLFNPAALITSITPATVAVGQSYTLDIVGSQFAANSIINVSGAIVGTPQYLSDTEIKVPVQIKSAGVQAVSVNNPNPYAPTNGFFLRSLPASLPASSSVAVTVATVNAGGGATSQATKAYIPESSTVAVVNLDANKQSAVVVMPDNYHPSIAVANPVTNQIIVASTTNNQLQIVDANLDTVINAFNLPISTTTTVNGDTCGVCGMMIDALRNRVILDTAAGYFTLNLADGTTTPALSAPAAANFTYDPVSQRIFAPFNLNGSAGMNVIDLVADAVEPVQPGGQTAFGTGTDSALFDPGTSMVVAGDGVTSNFLELNFNGQSLNGATLTAPAGQFAVTSGCPGTWDAVSLDPTSHDGWFANQSGCVAVVVLPQSPVSGVPGIPATIKWAQVPIGPDGVAWSNTPPNLPHSLIVYTGADGRVYGLAVRQDTGTVLKVDLALMLAANAVQGGADVNQVDPTNVTVNGATVTALTFIALH